MICWPREDLAGSRNALARVTGNVISNKDIDRYKQFNYYKINTLSSNDRNNFRRYRIIIVKSMYINQANTKPLVFLKSLPIMLSAFAE